MYQIHVSGSLEDHKAVKRAFANLVRELRKVDPTIDARYFSQDGREPDHVDHPSGEGYTGENPQIISGTHGEVA